MSDLHETPEERQWVISLDLSHLTQQEILHLHALKNQAQLEYLKTYAKSQEIKP